MALDCSKLGADLVAAKCSQATTAGLEDDVILLNFDEVNKEGSAVTKNVISDIEMIPTKKGYTFTSFGKSFNESGATFTKGTYRNSWAHTLMLRVFTKDEKSKEFVNQLSEGARLIAVVKNKETGPGGEVKYEAYGWDNGLELNEATSVVEMTDGVVYSLSLGSGDTAQEGSLPKSINAGTLAETEEVIKSLIKIG